MGKITLRLEALIYWVNQTAMFYVLALCGDDGITLSLLTNLSGSAGTGDPDPAVPLLLHDNSASRTSVISTNTLFFPVQRVKVAEQSFGSLWVHVICQIMAIERLQFTNWNLASEKCTDERFWLTGKMWRFLSFHGNMNDWTQP